MPCNGVARTTAWVNFDVGAHFMVEAHREQFRQWLLQQNVQAKSWWELRNGYGWAIGIGSEWTGIAFDRNEIKISDENSDIFERTELQCREAEQLAQLYIGQQIQATVIGALQEMGLEPRDATQDEDGALEVRVNVGAGNLAQLYRETARIKIGLDGSMQLVTEDGQFEAGKKKLEILLGMLGNRLENAQLQPSNEYEQHRHTEAHELVWNTINS